jgi:hypothetical protein
VLSRMSRASIAVLLLLLSLSAASSREAEPLTEEEVVRMSVRGASAEAIIAEVGSRPAQFALDEEMIAELVAAGVPQVVIDAMLERMAELEPVDEPVLAQEPALSGEAPPLLRILLNPDRKPDKPELLRLSDERSEFSGIAIFLACRSPTHVPDHWRSRSPLGRDFERMPRHRLLSFVDGAEHKQRKNGPDLFELEIPPALEVALEADAPHHLMLGVAVEIEGRYYLGASIDWEGFVLDEARDLRATITSGKHTTTGERVQIRFDKPDAPPD